MTYWQLRLKIYTDELRKMLESVSQLFIFLSVLLQAALPAFMLTALISLSVIESNETLISTRIYYQWGYFVLLFFLIKVQKKAILGGDFQLYLASIPTTKLQKSCARIFLTGLAGNLLLLTPMFLTILNLGTPILTTHLYFSLFAISTLLTAWFAVNCSNFPLASLFIFPALMSVNTVELIALISTNVLNTLWLIMFLIDYSCKPITVTSLFQIPMKYYWQIKWFELKAKPINPLSRLLVCALLIVSISYAQNELGGITSSKIQMVCLYIFSLVIGSFQFDNEKLYRKYSFYLQSITLSSRKRYLYDTLPVTLITLAITVIIYQYLAFSFINVISLLLGTAITIFSVTKYQRNFFIAPTLLFIFLLFLV